MDLRAYNDMVVREIRRCQRDYIKNTPQPTMMGGVPLRAHPLPGFTSQMGEPGLGVGQHFRTLPVRRGRLGQQHIEMVPMGKSKRKAPRPRMAPMEIEMAGGRRKKKNIFKSFTHGLADVGRVLAPIGKEVGKEVLKDSIKGLMMGAGQRGRARFNFHDLVKTGRPIVKEIGRVVKPRIQRALGSYPQNVQGGAAGAASGRGRTARHDIVKAVMQKHGMKLIEASKFVKQNNLY